MSTTNLIEHLIDLFVRKNQNIAYMGKTNFDIEISFLAYIEDLTEYDKLNWTTSSLKWIFRALGTLKAQTPLNPFLQLSLAQDYLIVIVLRYNLDRMKVYSILNAMVLVLLQFVLINPFVYRFLKNMLNKNMSSRAKRLSTQTIRLAKNEREVRRWMSWSVNSWSLKVKVLGSTLSTRQTV